MMASACPGKVGTGFPIRTCATQRMQAWGSMKLDMSTYEPFGLEAIETASRDEIAALQSQRIKHTLERVYENVPAYRKKFDGAGVTPADFKRLEDLSKFPFTTKHDLRENYPFGMFAVPRERIARVHASSGTTGKATVVG